MKVETSRFEAVALDSDLLFHFALPSFPIRPDNKKPFVPGGYLAATLKHAQLEKWAEEFPAAMAGIPTGERTKFFVLDCDKRHGGLQSLSELASNYGRLPARTPRIRTPGGGLHILFRYPTGLKISSRAGDIARGVDVRGHGGYVVAPGSVRDDGKQYVWESETRWDGVSEAPVWLLYLAAFCKSRRERLAEHGITGPHSFGDLPPERWQERASEILKPKIPVGASSELTEERKAALLHYVREAIQRECVKVSSAAQGTRDSTLNTSAILIWSLLKGAAAEGVETAETEDQAFADLAKAAEEMDPGTDGQVFDEDTTRDKWERTAVAADARCLAHAGVRADPRVEFGDIFGEDAAKFKPTPFEPCDPKDIQPREWVYEKHLIRKFLSGTIATGGVGKSSLVLTEAIAMASGKALPNHPLVKRCRVWYWNGEDPIDELQRRIAAICLKYEIDQADLKGWLFVDTGRKMPITIARETRDGFAISKPVVGALINQIKINKIDVIAVDPFVACHKVSENDNVKMEAVASEWLEVVELGNCAGELVHHTRKTAGAETTAEDSRGASAVSNKMRDVRTLNRMTETEANKAGVTNRRLYFRVDSDKGNLAPPADIATWFKLENQPLGNIRSDRDQDHIGVAVPWSWPDAFEDLPPDALAIAQEAIRTQKPTKDEKWRESSQATDWVGIVIGRVLEIDPNSKPGAARLKKIIANWISIGGLQVITAQDDKRRERKFIEVGDFEY